MTLVEISDVAVLLGGVPRIRCFRGWWTVQILRGGDVLAMGASESLTRAALGCLRGVRRQVRR